MAITFSGADYNRMDQNYQAGLAHKDRMNSRNMKFDIDKAGIQMPQNPLPKPFNYADLKMPDTNQVGPTAAEVAAQQIAKQPVPDYPGYGADKQTAAPAGGLTLSRQSRVGTMNAPKIRQVNPSSPAPVKILQGAGASLDVAAELEKIRTNIPTGKQPGLVATSPAARFWSWLTDAADSPIHAKREEARVVGDYVKTTEFGDIIRNDPNRLAEFEADPFKFHKKYASGSVSASAPVTASASATAGGSAIPNSSGFSSNIGALLKREGGYVNDPNDPGGETNFGITKKTYPNLDIRNLTQADAIAIYQRDFWDAIDADNLPANMQAVAFDTAVLFGQPAARKMIAKAKGNPQSIIDQRRAYITAIIKKTPAQQKFAAGWEDRNKALEKSLTATTSVATSVAPTAPAVVAGQPVTIGNSGRKKKGGVVLNPTEPAQQLAVARDVTKVPPPKSNLSFTFRSDQMQALQQQRQSLIRKAKIDSLIQGPQGGGIETLTRTRELVAAHDIMIGSMAKKQAIDLLSNNNDPRMLNLLLSRQSGQQVEYSPNSDGTWRESVNGQVIVPSMKLSNITSVQTNAADKAHYDAMKAAAVAAKASQYGKQLDAMLKIQVKNAEQNNVAYIETLKKGGFFKSDDGTYWTNGAGRAYRIVENEGMDGGPPTIQLQPITATGGVTSYRTGG